MAVYHIQYGAKPYPQPSCGDLEPSSPWLLPSQVAHWIFLVEQVIKGSPKVDEILPLMVLLTSPQ